MALDRDIQLLAQVPILSLFDHDALRLLAFSAESRILRAGDVLFRKGEAACGGYLVVSGSIGLDAQEDGALVEHVVVEGALIGEMALFTETVRPATAIAREPSTVLLISARAMRRLLEEDGLREKMGAVARQRAAELSWEHGARVALDALHEAAA